MIHMEEQAIKDEGEIQGFLLRPTMRQRDSGRDNVCLGLERV